MKVKPSNYHSSTGAAKPQSQAIHQPVLSNSHHGGNTAQGSSHHGKEKQKSNIKGSGSSTKHSQQVAVSQQQSFYPGVNGQETTPSGKG